MCSEGNPAERPSPVDPTLRLINFDRYQVRRSSSSLSLSPSLISLADPLPPSRSQKMARIVGDLQRFQVPYNLVEVPEIQSLLSRALEGLAHGGDATSLCTSLSPPRDSLLFPLTHCIVLQTARVFSSNLVTPPEEQEEGEDPITLPRSVQTTPTHPTTTSTPQLAEVGTPTPTSSTGSPNSPTPSSPPPLSPLLDSDRPTGTQLFFACCLYSLHHHLISSRFRFRFSSRVFSVFSLGCYLVCLLRPPSPSLTVM